MCPGCPIKIQNNIVNLVFEIEESISQLIICRFVHIIGSIGGFAWTPRTQSKIGIDMKVMYSSNDSLFVFVLCAPLLCSQASSLGQAA